MLIQEQVAVALLRQANLPQDIQDIHPLTTNGMTNHVALITLRNGARVVFRQYHWPWDGRDLNRPQKEQYLHALLHQAGVPVPAIHAHVDVAGQAAALLEYVPGEVLGDIAPSLPHEASAQVWRSCGQ